MQSIKNGAIRLLGCCGSVGRDCAPGAKKNVFFRRAEPKDLGKGCLKGSLARDYPMPTALQYPLERSRGLQQKWDRLLQRYPMPHWSFGLATLINTIPPRDPDDDDNDDEEEDDVEVDREPAVIREPDKDE
jgi:hypothetical protein